MSGTEHVRISALAADDAVAGSALVSANTLANRHCGVIVAAGQGPVAAARDIAPRYTGIQFVLVGSGTTGANVTWVDAGSDVRAGIRNAVRPLVS